MSEHIERRNIEPEQSQPPCQKDSVTRPENIDKALITNTPELRRRQALEDLLLQQQESFEFNDERPLGLEDLERDGWEKGDD